MTEQDTPELITMSAEPLEPGENALANLSRAVAADLRGDLSGALEQLESIPPGTDFAEALAARARLRMETGQFVRAASDLEQLAALRPASVRVHLDSALCFFHLARFDKGFDRLRTAGALDPSNAEIPASCGICLLRMKLPEEALEAFRKALELSPSDDAALLGHAVALQMCFELDQAEEAYSKILEAQPDSRVALANLVLLGLQKKDDALVRDYARILLALDPDSETALSALATVSFQSGAFEAAALHCAHLVRLRPEQHDYWYNLGVAEERRANLSQAARAFENAASADSGSASAFLACAAVYEKMSDDVAARRSLERALRLAPERADLRYHTAVLAERQGYAREAELIYSGLLTAEPDHVQARFRLGFLKLEQGDYAAAAEAFEACLGRRAEWPEAEINLSIAYARLNRADDARAVLDRLLERDPGCQEALRGIASLALDNQPELAQRAIDRLVASGDRSPEVLFNAGVVHQKAAEWEQAAVCYREALALQPKFPEALVNLGHALMSQNDEKGARENWALALELNPELARGYFLAQ
jgi:tetratricopeptide (TPR) repeat protein